MTNLKATIARIARDQRNAAMALRYRGDSYECPICHGSFRTMLPVADRRANASCPRCRSFERHRLLWLYLEREVGVTRRSMRILHVAPEPGTARRLLSQPGIDYVTTDIGGVTAMVRADLTALPFPDASFDIVLCSHVLEHIPEDRAAMRQMRRVTAPGGRTILQHPIDPDRAETYEDFSITDPAERERAFFQRDHVRIYGRDIAERLTEAGFRVTIVDYNERLTPKERERYRTVQYPSSTPEHDLQADAIYLCDPR